MRPQTDIRNMLLENGEKEILVVKLQRSRLNCVCVIVFCGRQNLRVGEIGYSAKAISKQSVKDTAWLFLIAYSKIQEERNGLKTKLLSKNGLEL